MNVASVSGSSPSGSFPAWHPHPDIWLLVLTLAMVYAWAMRRYGPPEGAASRRQVLSYLAGLAVILAALDWPIDDLGDHYLFSVHMVQHTLLSLVAPPLILFGLPAWLLRRMVAPRAVNWLVRNVTRPFVALVYFNAVIVVTHWPAWVNLTLRNEPFHFASHALLFTSAMAIWWPVLSPLPEMPTMSYPGRMVFLFLQSIVPTVPASFLTFGSAPLYSFYATVPRLWGLSVIDDQRLAGLIMKILGGLILWGVIAVIFFRWYRIEHETEGWDSLEWHRMERELHSRPAPTTKVVKP